MLRKLSAAFAIALAATAAPGARADEAPAADEAQESEAKPAEPEASAEPADEAEAEEEGEDDALAYDRDGWYLGLGGGGSIEFFQHGSANDSGYVRGHAGYHFLRFAALEAQLEYTPKFKGKSGDYDGVNTEVFGIWGNIKGYPTAPWTGPVQPFGMIGLGWWWQRRWGSAVDGTDENGGFVSRFGGGVDFYITRNIVVTAETAYVVPTGHVSELDQLQIGGALQYRFDP